MIGKGLADKALKGGLDQVKTVLESIHAHLEIQTRVLIRIQKQQLDKLSVEEDEVEEIINRYQELVR